MKKLKIILILLLIIIAISYFFLNTKRYNEKNQTVDNCDACIIKTEIAAINVAENILFKVYGESKIKNERPYNIVLIDNKTWVISGSLNKSYIESFLYRNFQKYGGSFEIILDASTGKTIKLIHYKWYNVYV